MVSPKFIESENYISKMKRHSNYSQWKEQEKSPEKISNETDLPNLPDPKFKKAGNKNAEGIKKDYQ